MMRSWYKTFLTLLEIEWSVAVKWFLQITESYLYNIALYVGGSKKMNKLKCHAFIEHLPHEGHWAQGCA